MYTQYLVSALEYASGPLLPLVTAIVAAWVALRIASHNARRTTERDAISELRKAYASWCDIISEMATNKMEEQEYENHGWQKDQSHGKLTEEAQQHVQSIARLNQAASRVRILDAALPKEFDIINTVLEYQKWNPELGELDEHADICVAVNRHAQDLMGQVAGRLLSKNPFRMR